MLNRNQAVGLSAVFLLSGIRPVAALDDDAQSSLAAILLAIIAISVAAIVYLSYRIDQMRKDAAVIDEEESAVVTDENRPRNWEIAYPDLEMGDPIGKGVSGKVYKARWRGLQVAVKELTLTQPRAQDELAVQLQQLIAVRHPTLVLFMGMARPEPSRMLLVTEYMARGNLLSVLSNRKQSLDWMRRINIALDVARAMNYLHCCKPPIVHRHLDSINILVDKDYVAKVTDYGLETLRSSLKQTGASNPLWTAPENFKKAKYTPASDVYGFGVVLWELLTRRLPYSGEGRSGHLQKLIQEITDGERPRIPTGCPPAYASLMTRCWQPDAGKRPTFATIAEELTELAKLRPDLKRCEEFLEVKVERPFTGSVMGVSGDLSGSPSLRNGSLENSRANSRPPTAPTTPRGSGTLAPVNLATNTPGGSLRLIGGGSAREKPGWTIDWNELKLEAPLGSGSFGEVHAAIFRGKRVAVKKFPPAPTSGPGKGAPAYGAAALRQFLHELNVMYGLRHQNIISLIGACLEPQHPSLVLEYAGKGSLFDLLHDVSQPFDYNLIMKTAISVTQGLLYLHSESPPILHRDLKSHNILVDDEWNVKVSDFGLSGVRGAARALAAGQVGSPFWMAPEVMEKGDDADSEAADVYSLGVVMWELFTRQVPYAGMTAHQAALAVLTEDKRPEMPPFVPPNFAKLITDCWARDPAARPPVCNVLDRLRILKAEGLPRLELGFNNAKLYAKRAAVYAFRSKDTVIVFKSWGTGEGKRGDYVMVGPDDDVYTCDAPIFAKTYRALPGVPNAYKKVGKIFAREMEHAFLLETLEGMEHGAAGDFLAQNPVDGEQWPISRKSFMKMYVLASKQTIEEEEEGPVDLPTSINARPKTAATAVTPAKAGGSGNKSTAPGTAQRRTEPEVEVLTETLTDIETVDEDRTHDHEHEYDSGQLHKHGQDHGQLTLPAHGDEEGMASGAALTMSLPLSIDPEWRGRPASRGGALPAQLGATPSRPRSRDPRSDRRDTSDRLTSVLPQ